MPLCPDLVYVILLVWGGLWRRPLWVLSNLKLTKQLAWMKRNTDFLQYASPWPSHDQTYEPHITYTGIARLFICDSQLVSASFSQNKEQASFFRNKCWGNGYSSVQMIVPPSSSLPACRWECDWALGHHAGWRHPYLSSRNSESSFSCWHFARQIAAAWHQVLLQNLLEQ